MSSSLGADSMSCFYKSGWRRTRVCVGPGWISGTREVCVCVSVCVCENRRSRWLSFIHVLQCKQRLHEHKRLLRRVEQTESALLIFKWWRSYWTPDSLHKSDNFRSCWVKTNFINVMKLYLWQILNHWSLLINSALNVIYKADYHPKSHQTPFTNQLI